jgi:hypothetical protein
MKLFFLLFIILLLGCNVNENSDIKENHTHLGAVTDSSIIILAPN